MNATLPAGVIFVNGSPSPLAGPTTLGELLAGLGLSERKGVAAAVNGEVVPRSAWNAHGLAGNDRVLVIRATQGG